MKTLVSGALVVVGLFIAISAVDLSVQAVGVAMVVAGGFWVEVME